MPEKSICHIWWLSQIILASLTPMVHIHVRNWNLIDVTSSDLDPTFMWWNLMFSKIDLIYENKTFSFASSQVSAWSVIFGAKSVSMRIHKKLQVLWVNEIGARNQWHLKQDSGVSNISQRGGASTPEQGAKTYYLARFWLKTAWK